MDIGIELSLYPLDRNFIPPIQDFIDRLNTHPNVRVTTNSMSTQVFGDYDAVMQAVQQEIRTTLEQQDKAVFVMKVLGKFPDA